MKKIAKSLTDLIGNTPLLELSNYNKKHELNGILVAKLEYFNPAGSVKDRIALSMIEEAEQKGLLKSHATIIEPTSGNTGVGLAFVSAARGYRLILTMPDTMSMERRNLLKALGAQLILTPGSEGMAGAIQKAKELNEEIEGSIILQQFENPENNVRRNMERHRRQNRYIRRRSRYRRNHQRRRNRTKKTQPCYKNRSRRTERLAGSIGR